MHADFSSQSYFQDPAAAIARMRSMGPLIEVHFPIVGRVWTTTTQELADQVLKDDKTFTMRREDGAVAGTRWWMLGIVRTLATSMLSMDEPDHARLRGIVEDAFRRRAVLEMEPRILALAEDLADQLFAAGSPADLVERYARTLPLSVICELLGLPIADRAKFYQLGERPYSVYGRARLFHSDTQDPCHEALHGGSYRIRTRAWRRGFDCRAGSGRKGRRSHQPQRDGGDAFPVAVRGTRNHYPPGQRRGARAVKELRVARLAADRLEPDGPRRRGIPQIHHAGPIHKAALCPTERRT